MQIFQCLHWIHQDFFTTISIRFFFIFNVLLFSRSFRFDCRFAIGISVLTMVLALMVGHTSNKRNLRFAFSVIMFFFFSFLFFVYVYPIDTHNF